MLRASMLIGMLTVFSSGTSDGAAIETGKNLSVKPDFYFAAESTKPLAGVRQGENIELFFVLTNWRVTGINYLKLKLEPDPNLEIAGEKRASFHGIAATGGSIRMGIKCRLKSSMGRLTISYSAKYFEGGAARGQVTIIIGRSPKLGCMPGEITFRWLSSSSSRKGVRSICQGARS